MQTEIVSLEELKQNIEMIIDEHYQILSRNLKESDAYKMIKDYEQACQLVRQVQELEDVELKDATFVQEVLSEGRMHLKQMEAQLAYQNKKGDALELQNKNLKQFYTIFHNYICHIKQATLLIKSQKLSKKEHENLTEVKSKFTEANKNDTMRRVLQLKKQNDDGQHVLNQVEKKINQDVQETEKRLRNIEGECIKLQAEWKMKDISYRETLKQENQRKIDRLRFGSSRKEEVKPVSPSRLQGRRQHTNVELSAVKIVQYNSPYEKIEQYAALCLLIVTVIVMFYVGHLFSSDRPIV